MVKPNAVIVVGGIIEQDGKFLLVQEKKEQCYGKWNIPAGRLELNETIFEGATREIFEETGFSVELIDLLKLHNEVKDNYTFISMIFSTKIVDGKIKINKNEILDIKMFSYEEIINMKDELRNYSFIVASIEAYINKTGCSKNIIKIIDNTIK